MCILLNGKPWFGDVVYLDNKALIWCVKCQRLKFVEIRLVHINFHWKISTPLSVIIALSANQINICGAYMCVEVNAYIYA